MKFNVILLVPFLALLVAAAPANPKTPANSRPASPAPPSPPARPGTPNGSDCHISKPDNNIFGKTVCCKRTIENGALKSHSCVTVGMSHMKKPNCPATHPKPECCPLGEAINNNASKCSESFISN
ncbi:hypothetical protein FPQ18DRAFT_308918 [Pyronema domesticum]|nr:hypothetical protein FPQ18DRAFT_308918 [Pyronema domesticum]